MIAPGLGFHGYPPIEGYDYPLPFLSCGCSALGGGVYTLPTPGNQET